MQSHQGDLYRFDLSPELAERVRRFQRRPRADHVHDHDRPPLRPCSTATAASRTCVSARRWRTASARRAKRLIGAFLNTQVLRCRLDGQMSVGELLEQVRQTVIDGQSHQDLPFDHLVEALQPPRSAAYNPLFQVMCNVQRWRSAADPATGRMTVECIANDARATKFDLNPEVTDLDQRLGCRLDLQPRPSLTKSRIARMAGHRQNLLEALLGDPQRRIAELPLFAAEERKYCCSPARPAQAGPRTPSMACSPPARRPAPRPRR
ncbi:condensation domain-containing protein [Pseudomonas aeruginosa]